MVKKLGERLCWLSLKSQVLKIQKHRIMGSKVVLNDINSAFPDLFFFVFAPKIDRFLVVSCDVLKQCEESVTIIDGGCARVAKNILCKIFIILAYSQYRRYKYSSCTPPGCYEICCYLFSEGTLMRPPPVIAEVSPPGNTYKYGCCVCLYNILQGMEDFSPRRSAVYAQTTRL